MSGLYLAKERGYFADEGLQVTIESIPSSTHAIPLAAAGKLDVIFSSSSVSLVNAIAKGSRLRIVAGREITAPSCSENCTLYGLRKVFPDGLRDVRALRGKRVAADTSSSIASFGIDAILTKAGMTTKDIDLISMRKSELVVAFLSEKIDAIFLSDFSIRFSDLQDQIVTGIRLADVLPNHQISFITYGSRLLDDEPEAGIQFLSAYLRGAREYLGGATPAFHGELAVSNGMDPVKARNACRNSMVPDGRIDIPSLERFIQWAVKKELCPHSIRAEGLIDRRFLEGLPKDRTSPGATGLETTELNFRKEEPFR